VQKKVHILKDDFAEQTLALGLVSSESVFQLILQLNKTFSLSLKLVKPIAVETSEPSVNFPYALYDEEDELKVHLIKSKHEGKLLFKNQSSMDYILVVTGKNSSAIVEKFIQKSKQVTSITLASPIDIKKIKNIHSFLI
jgi:hypothetical protein